MKERIFALDIGTRSVVGIIIEESLNSYHVIDIITKEHEERSMVDGQIHDILSVSTVIQSIKEELEAVHGPLHKVCVAAAGRALKTKRTYINTNIQSYPFMNQDDITHMELSAVQQAQYELAREEDASNSIHYYCVGYSVLHYYLDEEEIGSLVDQQGNQASVEIIATFLPKVVVESLLSALQRADLEMEALTLEPIAAINVLIPESMRRLNVALVDIGAGTSDIAITEQGTVTAYGMVPVAGDEMTEAISDEYLLDFPLAEQAKRELTTQDYVTTTDILGMETEVPYEEMVGSIEPAITKLSESIREEIISLNSKAPKAVMLIGGGSLTPELPKLLSKQLGLPENRVAIRGIDAIPKLEKTANLPEGPAFVTPIGIAIASKQSPVQYITVQVNNRTVRMFDLKTLTVGDCLLAAGIEMNTLYGRPGMAYIVRLNGKDITLPGEHGSTPTLQLNKQTCSLQDPIQHGDELLVVRGIDGQSPHYTLRDLIGDLPSIQIHWNDIPYNISPNIQVNHVQTPLDYEVQDHDSIDYHYVKTIRDFFYAINQTKILSMLKSFKVSINHIEHELSHSLQELRNNGITQQPESKIEDGDHITTTSVSSLTVEEVMKDLNLDPHYEINVTFNGTMINLHKPLVTLRRSGEPLSLNDMVFPDDVLTSEEVVAQPFIYQDIFRYVDIDLNNTKGHNFKILRNGEEATFFDPLTYGDELELHWYPSQTN
ncbi:cell division protein FtsA [Pontibacillus yanchengensis]|uniref:Cell division protein FtsA n=1 Tax=Pontibacillus yanchengensis Y32 TaxID=1385514 RepID=A0A0A2TWK5_9BACI|nr:cell division protein FtsA [Pontibacillus yanchengensis]KGP73665.1 cell division protein FtsA [Pontibacillus yanchengensis Y32]